MWFDVVSGMPSHGHVLIVEDDADAREMLVTLLGDEGFQAVAAEDGLEALHLLRTVRHPARPALPRPARPADAAHERQRVPPRTAG